MPAFDPRNADCSIAIHFKIFIFCFCIILYKATQKLYKAKTAFTTETKQTNQTNECLKACEFLETYVVLES